MSDLPGIHACRPVRLDPIHKTEEISFTSKNYKMQVYNIIQNDYNSWKNCLAQRAMLISDSAAASQTPTEAARQWTLASMTHGVPVYSSSSYAGTKLYSLVTVTNVCEQLAKGRTQKCRGRD